ncbi:MAG: YdeI/OmpD-associated family protein [Bacteroidia bacterium]
MASLHFSATIRIIGVNPYVLVNAARAKQLKAGWKKPMPVLVQVNGAPKTPWKINMMPTGTGSFYLYLHGDVRKASKTVVGDKVEVTVSFDEEYKNGPQHPVPPSLQKAIKQHTNISRAWKALTPSRQKEILRYLANIKSEAALERNIAKVIYVLSGKQSRFLGRDWKNGK